MTKPDWKISLIPKDSGNATDPTVALDKELEQVISDPKSLKQPEPIETISGTAPRYNANAPYNPEPITFTENDQVLLKAIREAVKNGWRDYHRYANDSVTIGLEAEAVVTGMKKQSTRVQELLFDKTFARSLWPHSWRKKLTELVLADDTMKYLKSNLDD